MTQTTYPEILPCRKCGSKDVEWWNGCGTQADLVCSDCGQEEGIQVCDLFDYGDERRHYQLQPPSYRYSDEIIAIAHKELADEWNKRIS